MESYQERVVTEKAELDVKIQKLHAFSNEWTFTILPESEQDRLLRQVAHMKEYSNILRERIMAFPQ